MMPIVWTGRPRFPLILRAVAVHRLVGGLPSHKPPRAGEQPPHDTPVPPASTLALQPGAAASPAAPAVPPAPPAGAGAANQRSTSRTKKLAPMGSKASLKS